MSKKKCVAIIPARGGSKRIPNKNIKDFFGKPIIYYTIKTLRNSNLFDNIFVSTDSEEIKETAEKYGAHVPFIRPKSLADDHTPTIPVLADAIKQLKNLGYKFDGICWMYAIAPLVTAKDLQSAYEVFNKLKSKKAYVPACTEFSFPVQRGFHYEKKLQMLFPEHYWSRSQDLKKAFHEAGTFWFCHNEAILNNEIVLNPESIPYLIPHWRVQDIDYEEDWHRVEMIYEYMKNKELL